MNSASKHAVVALIVFSLTGCAPKNAKTSPPPQAQAPTAVPDAGKAGAMYPPPLTAPQSEPEPAPTAPAQETAQTEPTPEPEPPPPPAAKKNTKPAKAKPSAGKTGSTDPGTPTAASGDGATPAPITPPASETTVASTGEAPVATPIGELTPAGTPELAQKGKETTDLIGKIEDGLTSIKHPLSTQDQEIVSQIRSFLGKAKTALSSEDYDGAYVLATKAKVLLDELTKT